MSQRSLPRNAFVRTVLRPWTLEFRDPLTEQRFQLSWIRATAWVNRIWGLSGAVFYALFSILVLWLLPEDRSANLVVRGLIVAPLFLVALLILIDPFRFRRFLSLSYFLIALPTFFASVYLFNTSASHAGALSYLVESAMIFSYCQHYNRVRYRHVVVFTLLAGMGIGASLILHPEHAFAPIEIMLAVVLGLGLVGCFSAYTREIFIRRNYWSIRTLRAENERAEAAARQAKEANEAKSRFLAAISHELRTPLNAIIGYTDLIRSGVFGAIEQPKVREYLDDIGGSGGHLLKLVNDILDLAKAGEGGLYLSEDEFELAPVIDTVRRSFDADIERAGLEIRVSHEDAGRMLHADPRRLAQVIENLLSNAIKFTPRAGKITVDCRRLKTGQFRITVEDTGIGIPPAKLEKALSVFAQVDDGLNRQQEGTGIGLPLTKRLIELHGGLFEIESAEGVGTRVTVILPACRVVYRDTAEGDTQVQPAASRVAAA